MSFASYAPGAAREPVEIEVRRATAADLAEITRIQEAAGRVADTARLEIAVGDPARCVVVAETTQARRRRVVGWGQTFLHRAVVDAAPVGHYLGGVTVPPVWRRRGVARAVTEARMGWIAERADEAFYVVNPRNQASIELHRAWGFEQVGEADRLTGITFDGGTGWLMRTSVRRTGPAQDGPPAGLSGRRPPVARSLRRG